MLDRSDITAVNWQMRRDGNAAVLGDIATDYADLEQEIRQCILTPIGSIPLNPLKGCGIDEYRDRPMDLGGVLVAHAVREALTLWVPRIEVSTVTVTPLSISQLTISVSWRPTAAVLEDLRQTEVVYG